MNRSTEINFVEKIEELNTPLKNHAQVLRSTVLESRDSPVLDTIIVRFGVKGADHMRQLQ